MRGAVKAFSNGRHHERQASDTSRPEDIVDWTTALSGAAYSELLHSRTLVVLEDAGQFLGFSVLDAEVALINATYVSPGAARRGGVAAEA